MRRELWQYNKHVRNNGQYVSGKYHWYGKFNSFHAVCRRSHLFLNARKHCKSYEGAVDVLSESYSYPHKKQEYLLNGSHCRFGGIQECPDESEVDLFRKLVAKLISAQKHPDQTDDNDWVLRHHFFTPLEIMSIRTSSNECIPCMAYQLSTDIANRPSDKLREVAAASAINPLNP